jgi:DNA-binding winged helix-turn-helix (wHTH) protein/Tfp pilus assembly protein PilF
VKGCEQVAGREPQEFYEFGPYRVNVRERVLLRNGTPLSIPVRAFDVLVELLTASGQTVAKEQLILHVWRAVATGDNNLAQVISVLRKTLGRAETGHPYIETDSGRGYRFAGRVRQVEGNLRTLAVLPFHCLRTKFAALDAASAKLLELGTADAVISLLSESSEFVVRPLSAVRRYAGGLQDSLAAGKELQADAVLEGTLQCAQGRARVTLRLLRVSDGTSLWTGRLDREMNVPELASHAPRGVFELQDAVADLVANALLRRDTVNAEARKACALGRHFLGRRTAGDLERAAAYFQEAIAADPLHGRAWAGLADSYTMSGVLHYLPPKDSLGKAERAAMKALLLDDGLAEAHLSLAMVRLYYDWDFAAAEREFAHALRLNPDHATTHLWYGWYLATAGDFERALVELRRAHELDPLSLVVRSAMGEVLNASGQADSARLQLRATLELDGRFALAHAALARVEVMAGAFQEAIAEARLAIDCSGGDSGMVATLGYVYGVSGLRREARQVLAELREVAARRYVSPYYLAMVSMGLKQFDHAFEYLEQAYQERSGYLIWLRHMPLFAPPRQDPRFQKLLSRIGVHPGEALAPMRRRGRA